MICSVLRGAEKEQKSTKNITLSAFSPELIEEFVNDKEILAMMSNTSPTVHPYGIHYHMAMMRITSPIHYHIRGDALGYALDMIERILIPRLEFLPHAAVHAAFESERYPR